MNKILTKINFLTLSGCDVPTNSATVLRDIVFGNSFASMYRVILKSSPETIIFLIVTLSNKVNLSKIQRNMFMCSKILVTHEMRPEKYIESYVFDKIKTNNDTEFHEHSG